MLIPNNIDPADLTIEARQRLTKDEICRLIKSLYGTLQNVATLGVQLVDQNPYGLTHDEVREGFGDDLAELDKLYSILLTFIQEASTSKLV